jgi:hypothetical protein
MNFSLLRCTLFFTRREVTNFRPVGIQDNAGGVGFSCTGMCPTLGPWEWVARTAH